MARFWTEPSSGRSQSASTVSVGSRRSLQAAAGVRLPHRFRGKGELRKNDDGLLLRRDNLHVAISHSERHRRRGGARVARVRPLSSVRRQVNTLSLSQPCDGLRLTDFRLPFQARARLRTSSSSCAFRRSSLSTRSSPATRSGYALSARSSLFWRL